MKNIDLLTPNSTEASQLTGIAVKDYASAQRAAEALHATGVRQLIITLGMQGALLSTEKYLAHIPVYPAQPVDSTGAGDSFNGALAARLAAGEPLEQAALFASAYASVCVERAGAANAMPLYSDAIARMQQYPELAVTFVEQVSAEAT